MASVAVIGGGLQGCLAALALAAQGLSVTIFERRKRLLHGASRTNEGKIHAGYTYALDPSNDTIDLLGRHAADFEPLLARLLDCDPRTLIRYDRCVYALHRDSLLPSRAACDHFRRVDGRWRDRLDRAAGTRGWRFEAARRWDPAETRSQFGAGILEAYEVSETFVDPEALCNRVEAAIESSDRILVETGVRVARIVQGPTLTLKDHDDAEMGEAECAVNCAWEDLPGLAERSGGHAGGLCLRAKAGILTRAEGLPRLPVTISFGAFGDIVPLGGDRVYISWYPACLAGFTTDTADGVGWYEGVRRAFDATDAYRCSVRELSAICPGIVFADRHDDAHVCPILAHGRSDIHDPQSGLHRRTVVGITRSDRLFSINTGKLASAATFAIELAGAFVRP